MLFIAVIVRAAERLNDYGAKHWKEFATQNYFDRRGIFIGIMLCGPLLLDSFMMLFMFVIEASQLLVEVKREELRRKKEKSQNSKSSGQSSAKVQSKKRD